MTEYITQDRTTPSGPRRLKQNAVSAFCSQTIYDNRGTHGENIEVDPQLSCHGCPFLTGGLCSGYNGATDENGNLKPSKRSTIKDSDLDRLYKSLPGSKAFVPNVIDTTYPLVWHSLKI